MTRHKLLLAIPILTACAGLSDAASQAGRAVERAAIAHQASQHAVIQICIAAEVALREVPAAERARPLAEVRRHCDMALDALAVARSAIDTADRIGGAE